MFFISWGAHGALAQVGEGEVLHCERCGTDNYFSTMVAYTVRHVWWLFRWTTDRQFYRQCSQCLGAEHLDERDVDQAGVKAAISFWDRRGWTIGAGIIASLFGLGTIAAAQDASENRAFVQAPHVGDIYEVDLARMSDKPEAPIMIAAMRVVDVKPQGVEVELANVYYDDRRGVDRDISDRSARYPGYYRSERLGLDMAALRRLQDDGTIIDVQR